ncbi:Aldehyde/histidinol dehydrogenase [Aspergillus venezuelensis]
MAGHYAGKALDIHGITSLTSQNHLNISIGQPYGVTGAIIPWKSTQCPPNKALLQSRPRFDSRQHADRQVLRKGTANLAPQAGFPPGVLNVLSGFGMPCGDASARHMEIRKSAFTGSTRTERLIQRAAVESNLKSCTLELGGKSPLIVFDDADLDRAADAAAFSIVTNLGQVCMASSRVYVHHNVAGKFQDLYAQAIARLAGRPGDPNNAATSFGPQADEQQMKSVLAYLELAQRDNLQRLPLGGFKGYGTGRELGDEGPHAWTETKSVFIELS